MFRLIRARQQTAGGDDVGQLAMEALQNRAMMRPGEASNLAVIEGAARIVGHALATATVDGTNGTKLLTPQIREMVGRQLIKIRRGLVSEITQRRAADTSCQLGYSRRASTG